MIVGQAHAGEVEPGSVAGDGTRALMTNVVPRSPGKSTKTSGVPTGPAGAQSTK